MSKAPVKKLPWKSPKIEPKEECHSKEEEEDTVSLDEESIHSKSSEDLQEILDVLDERLENIEERLDDLLKILKGWVPISRSQSLSK